MYISIFGNFLHIVMCFQILIQFIKKKNFVIKNKNLKEKFKTQINCEKNTKRTIYIFWQYTIIQFL